MSIGSFVIDTMAVEVETTIDATCQVVFEAIVHDIQKWWGTPYLHRDDASGMKLERQVGGSLWEAWPDGGGALWGRVVCVQPDALLAIEGPMGMPGPVTAMVRFTLRPGGPHEADEQSCTLRVTHRAFGRLTQEMKEEYAVGWDDLIRLRLKPYVELGECYGLGHEPPAEVQARLRGQA